MKYFVLISIMIIFAFGVSFDKINSLTVPFIENQGQISKEVQYYAKTFAGTVFVTKDCELLYSLPKIEEKTVKGWTIKEHFIGSSQVSVKGENKALTKVSYFKGKDSSKWRSDIPTFNDVSIKDLYKGIDLKLKAYGKNVEKCFYVNAGTNPEKIKIKIEGAQHLEVNEREELVVVTELGDVVFAKPIAYQEINDDQQFVDVAYMIRGNEYGFVLGIYDKTKMLIIDPLLASTFIGGEYGDVDWHAVVLDANGNIYIAGVTSSSSFPTTPGAYDEIKKDIFISKLDKDLSTLLASTYFGSSNSNDMDGCKAIALDKDGNVFVAGWTRSYTEISDFPVTPGAYDETFNDSCDAFISKFDNGLSTLLASTFLGGKIPIFSDPDDGVSCMVIDENNNVYVAGGTMSIDFPTTPNAYDQSHDNCCDIFVSRFNNDLTTLDYSTFLGGSHIDGVTYMVLGKNGRVYLTGETASNNFPTTPNAYDTTLGYDAFLWMWDVYVSCFDSSLSTLLASTYLGAKWDDVPFGIAVKNDNVYVTGWTQNEDFPTTPEAYDTIIGKKEPYSPVDVFISKFDKDLTTLCASTFLGGNKSGEQSYSIAVNDYVYVTGTTSGPDFPTTPDAFDPIWHADVGDDWCTDAFVSKLDNNLTTLLASTYLGGTVQPNPWGLLREEGYAIALDKDGNVYVVGSTGSSDFPITPGAFDETWNGCEDIFIAKFDKDLSSGLGVEEERSLSDVNYIFNCKPNPFRERVNINCSKDVELDIYDITGRLVKSFSSSSVVWDGKDELGNRLPNGVYLLSVKGYKGNIKLVIVR